MRKKKVTLLSDKLLANYAPSGFRKVDDIHKRLRTIGECDNRSNIVLKIFAQLRNQHFSRLYTCMLRHLREHIFLLDLCILCMLEFIGVLPTACESFTSHKVAVLYFGGRE